MSWAPFIQTLSRAMQLSVRAAAAQQDVGASTARSGKRKRKVKEECTPCKAMDQVEAARARVGAGQL